MPADHRRAPTPGRPGPPAAERIKHAAAAPTGTSERIEHVQRNKDAQLLGPVRNGDAQLPGPVRNKDAQLLGPVRNKDAQLLGPARNKSAQLRGPRRNKSAQLLGPVLRRQSGAIHLDQMQALGVSRGAAARLVDAGILTRRHPGVYIDALGPLPPRGHLFAAWLAGGPDAFLSHRTALAIHGVRPLNLRAIEVTVVSGHTPRRHPGLFVHRTSVPPDVDEVRTLDGLRIASPSRALLDCAGFENDGELDRLIAELARNRLLDLERIDAAIARRAGVAGIVRLREALGRYRPTAPDKSAFEREFAAWLAADPEIPPPVRGARLGPWEVDFHWPVQGVVAETDGDRYHLTPQERERDVVKDAWLQRHGQLVLRVTGFRFMQDRPGVRGDLLGMLHLHSIRS